MVMHPSLSMDEALLRFRRGYNRYRGNLQSTIIGAGMGSNEGREQFKAVQDELELEPDVSLALR